jgi:nucleoside phosphorylase
MESSAIAQVCSKNKIPFFVVKGISDIINVTDTEQQDINKNISISSQKSFMKLISLFEQIKSHS